MDTEDNTGVKFLAKRHNNPETFFQKYPGICHRISITTSKWKGQYDIYELLHV